MRKNLSPKALMFPLPVLIIGTYDERGVANAMNAAWGSVCDYNKISIVVSKEHKTMENILKLKEFTVSMADCENLVPADYVGIVSGNNVSNKLEKTGWKIVKSENINAPIIENLPLTLECRLESYDEESEMLIGEVVNVSCDEKILTENSKIDLNVFKPLIYDTFNHGYYIVGQRVGNAFKDGNKLK